LYSIFDPYIRIPTWHTGHPLDDGRFYTALSSVIHNPAFSPDDMGSYMEQKVAGTQPILVHFKTAIAHRVVEAHAIRDYLALGLR
jgi:hypothetical protein